MPKEISIIGSGGHSRSVIALLRSVDFAPKHIYDNSFSAEQQELILGIPLAGSLDHVPSSEAIALAIGDNKQRQQAFDQFKSQIINPPIAHPTAFVDPSAKLGIANLVFPKAFLNADAHSGDNNIFNSGCIVEHECRIGSHCHISIGSILGGRVTVGNNCFIGAGVVVKDKISITDNVIIGAGSVVVKDITEPGTYVGNPIRKIR